MSGGINGALTIDFAPLLPDIYMYALCGLWWTDQAAFRLALPGYARMTTEVEFQSGCEVERRPVHELVESHHPLAVRL